MTREEARIELQAMKDTFEEYEPGGLRCQMALKVALTALRPVSREMVEKVWRGEWIDKRILSGAPSECSKCGHWVFENLQDMEFCPRCGTPMTDEAMEMVMLRLEALKDAKR